MALCKSNNSSVNRRGDGDQLFEYFNRTRSIRRSIIDAGQDTEAANFGRGSVNE